MGEGSSKSNIENIFENHWKYYSEQGAGILDTIHNLQGKIRQEYAGRVIYELLQNAFDSANEKIIVKIYENNNQKYLIVANDVKDGGLFTFEEKFNYNTKQPKNNFNSLCSIADSNKKFTESIGNKGIGFRSVFQVNEKIKDKVAYILIRNNIALDYFGFELYETANENIRKSSFFKDIEVSFNKNGQNNSLAKNKISGYCYPMLITDDKVKEFTKDFDAKIKTVIVVPLDENAYKNKIKIYIEKIKEIHFKFVSLKYNKVINIEFENEIKRVEEDNFLSYTNVKIDNNLKDLAGILNLCDEGDEFKIKVGCYYNSKQNYIYNYLPTEMNSPFNAMDIHSDFLTSLNRESMNLKDTEDEGKYNIALLTACVELHFLTLATYFEEEFKELTFKYINNTIQHKIHFDKDKFWKYLQFNNNSPVKKKTIEIIENIFNNDWNLFGDFIARLAKKYFNQDNLAIENFNDFWSVVELYSSVSRSTSMREDTSYATTQRNMKQYFIDNLQKNEAKVVPIVSGGEYTKATKLDKTTFVNLKKNGDKTISLPNSINIKITEYLFENLKFKLYEKGYLKEKILNELTQYDELLKHFRQISRSGEVNVDLLSEKEQKNNLKALVQIYMLKPKREKNNYISSHRYDRLFSEKDDSTRKQANFAISTFILKLKKLTQYKPAQYCYKSEIDKEWLKCIEEELARSKNANEKLNNKSLDDFLKFLGVSYDKNIRYVDYSYEFTLDRIPKLYQENENRKNNTSYVHNMRIFYRVSKESKFNFMHPSLVYRHDTFGSILENLNSNHDSKSLEIIVKILREYPIQYLEKLIRYLDDDNNAFKEDKTEELKNIYQAIFQRYRKLKISSEKNIREKYLIGNKTGLKFTLDLKGIFIPKKQKDFDVLWKNRSKTEKYFLLTFSDSDIDKYKSEDLKLSIVSSGEKV